MSTIQFLNCTGGHKSFWDLAARFSVVHGQNGLRTEKHFWKSYHDLIAFVMDDASVRNELVRDSGKALWDLTVALELGCPCKTRRNSILTKGSEPVWRKFGHVEEVSHISET